MKIKLSIIIPAYNAAKTLVRTVDSIVNQNYSNLNYEIIIINDGSTDNTVSVLNGISKLYKNVCIIHKENGGVSSARNAGLKVAQGDYIYFMDSDDTVESCFFETINNDLDGINDLICFGFNYFYKNHRAKSYKPLRRKNFLLAFLQGYFKLVICSIIAKKELYIQNSILFDVDTYYAEDIEVMVKLMVNSTRIRVLTKSIYNYLYSENSAMHNNEYSIKKFSSVIAHHRILEYLLQKKCEKELINAMENQLITVYYMHKKKYTIGSNKEIDSMFRDYNYIEDIKPKVQFTKFYVYNLIEYLRRKLF